MRHLRLLLATLWVGSLWCIGYVVAPTLFATLADRTLAGTIAGSLFRAQAWLSLSCAAALLLMVMRAPLVEMVPRKLLVRLILAMALCTLIGYFGLQPFMASLREAAAGVPMSGDARLQFGLLHGAASAIYLVQGLLGGWLILKLR